MKKWHKNSCRSTNRSNLLADMPADWGYQVAHIKLFLLLNFIIVAIIEWVDFSPGGVTFGLLKAKVRHLTSTLPTYVNYLLYFLLLLTKIVRNSIKYFTKLYEEWNEVSYLYTLKSFQLGRPGYLEGVQKVFLPFAASYCILLG